MTRRIDTGVFGLKAGASAVLLLAALGASGTASAGPCDPGQKPEARAAEAPAVKPVPVKPPRGSGAPARPNHAKAPPAPAGEPLPFFGPRGALAPHVV
jgi:hypothetical protein